MTNADSSHNGTQKAVKSGESGKSFQSGAYGSSEHTAGTYEFFRQELRVLLRRAVPSMFLPLILCALSVLLFSRAQSDETLPDRLAELLSGVGIVGTAFFGFCGFRRIILTAGQISKLEKINIRDENDRMKLTVFNRHCLRLLLVVPVFLVGLWIGISHIHIGWLDYRYESGVRLIQAEQYTRALEMLEPLKEESYEELEALRNLCQAHLCYDAGDLKGAYDYAWSRCVLVSDFPKSISFSTRSFQIQISREYRQYRESLAEAAREAREARVLGAVPFVGMAEKDVCATDLWKPGRVSYLGKHGTLYFYYREGQNNQRSGFRIFRAICRDGIVTEVYDEREDPYDEGWSKPTTCDCPFLGMPEALIETTELGQPELEYSFDTDITSIAAVYDFTKNDYLVFRAKCSDGIVTDS